MSASCRVDNRSVAAPMVAADVIWVDVLKVLAAQFIVWHHFVLYGPMAQAAHEAAPALAAWLAEYGLLAVQVFLVVGGYLSAQSLQRALPAAGAAAWPQVGGLVWRRWQRLFKPFALAMLLTMLAAWLARTWMTDADTPAAPTLQQVLAHALLLQDWLEVPALSVGVWYVAIDLQLYMSLLLWAALAQSWAAWARGGLLLVAVAASLWVWNLDSDWDMAPWYFWASYGLGALVQRAAGLSRAWQRALVVGLLAVVVVLALGLAWRSRVALAALVALSLWWAAQSRPLHLPLKIKAVLSALATQSYALFLLHYAASLVVSALASRWDLVDAQAAWWLLALSWALSMLAAAWITRILAQPMVWPWQAPQPVAQQGR